jgi:hypothetical protein
VRHDVGEQAAHGQFVARSRHGGAADVVVQVDVGLVHPDRAGQVERDPPHLLPVSRHQGEAAADGLDELGMARRWAVGYRK